MFPPLCLLVSGRAKHVAPFALNARAQSTSDPRCCGRGDDVGCSVLRLRAPSVEEACDACDCPGSSDTPTTSDQASTCSPGCRGDKSAGHRRVFVPVRHRPRSRPPTRPGMCLSALHLADPQRPSRGRRHAVVTAIQPRPGARLASYPRCFVEPERLQVESGHHPPRKATCHRRAPHHHRVRRYVGTGKESCFGRFA